MAIYNLQGNETLSKEELEMEFISSSTAAIFSTPALGGVG